MKGIKANSGNAEGCKAMVSADFRDVFRDGDVTRTKEVKATQTREEK